MTTQLQQSIRLLTLPRQELKETIQKELMENPLLEAQETDNTPEIPERENWKSQMVSASLYSFHQKKEPFVPFETYTAEQVGLKDHLLWQAQMDSFSKKEKSILSLLISHLNDDGYLTVSLEELRETSALNIHSAEDFKEALRRLQNMDPPGVGARDLRECLLAQARFMEEDTRDMELFDSKSSLQSGKKELSGDCLRLENLPGGSEGSGGDYFLYGPRACQGVCSSSGGLYHP